ncbi:Ribokinase [compost metagenome]
MSGLAVNSPETAEAAARHLLGLGAGKIIVTLGERGALLADTQGCEWFPVASVQALDTTAAGDTFVGGFAAALVQGRSERQAIAFGQAAAALSVTRAGAQPSIPYYHELVGP